MDKYYALDRATVFHDPAQDKTITGKNVIQLRETELVRKSEKDRGIKQVSDEVGKPAYADFLKRQRTVLDAQKSHKRLGDAGRSLKEVIDSGLLEAFKEASDSGMIEDYKKHKMQENEEPKSRAAAKK